MSSSLLSPIAISLTFIFSSSHGFAVEKKGPIKKDIPGQFQINSWHIIFISFYSTFMDHVPVIVKWKDVLLGQTQRHNYLMWYESLHIKELESISWLCHSKSIFLNLRQTNLVHFEEKSFFLGCSKGFRCFFILRTGTRCLFCTLSKHKNDFSW